MVLPKLSFAFLVKYSLQMFLSVNLFQNNNGFLHLESVVKLAFKFLSTTITERMVYEENKMEWLKSVRMTLTTRLRVNKYHDILAPISF